MTTKDDRPLRWGILGCGAIAEGAIVPAIHWSKNGVLQCIASRSPERAEAIARRVGAERWHGSYEALIEDPSVEAVYIGLPNGLHETWAGRAARAGKHVLCEKSLSLTGHSARAMVGEFRDRGLRLVEAFMYRHHPQWNAVRNLINEGAIGRPRAIEAKLTGRLDNPADHRWSTDLGGGALFDVTCYPVNVARYLLEGEPLRVKASHHARGDVDATSAALLEFPDGVLVQALGSLETAPSQGLTLHGEEGTIEVRRPFIPEWNPTTVVVRKGHDEQTVTVPGANHFLHQVEHFARLVREPPSPTAPAEDGLHNVLACEAIRRSFLSGKAVDVEKR